MNKMKVKIFKNANDKEVNEWLAETPDINIEYATQSSANNNVDMCIFYTVPKIPEIPRSDERVIFGN